MKFGKQIKRLAPPSHLGHYVSYDVLKQAVSVVTAKPEAEATKLEGDIKAVKEVFGESSPTFGPGPRPAESRFHDLLRHELLKVNRFAALQLQTTMEKLLRVQRTMQGAVTDTELEECERILDTVTEELCEFESFRRLNYTGFRKIVKKFDKRSEAGAKGASLSSWFLPQLQRESFVQAPLDDYFISLSSSYAAIRRAKGGGAGGPGGNSGGKSRRPHLPSTGSYVSEDDESRKETTTFWLDPRNRVRNLCTLLKNFEMVLPPGVGDGQLREKDWRQRLARTGLTGEVFFRSEFRIGSEAHMVYYDTPDLSNYAARLRDKAESTPLLRSRSIVPLTLPSKMTETVLIERDGSHSALMVQPFTTPGNLRSCCAIPMSLQDPEEPYSSAALLSAARTAKSAASSTQVADCPLPGVADFSAQAKESLKTFASEVESLASATAPNEQLRPVVSVASERLLLRGEADGIFLALDADVRCGLGALHPQGMSVEEDGFPFDLLEICGDLSDEASWLQELRGQGSLRAVDGFSYGLQAIAHLYKDQVPVLPEWYHHVQTAQLDKPAEAWGLAFEANAAYNELEQNGNSNQNADADPSARKETAEPLLLPKNYLASERTMLEWMHTAIALAVLGIGLWRVSLQGADTDIIFAGVLSTASAPVFALGCYGLTMVVVAVGFMWKAVFKHMARLDCMDAKPARLQEGAFNSRGGPIALAASIGVTLFIHMIAQLVPWALQ